LPSAEESFAVAYARRFEKALREIAGRRTCKLCYGLPREDWCAGCLAAEALGLDKVEPRGQTLRKEDYPDLARALGERSYPTGAYELGFVDTKGNRVYPGPEGERLYASAVFPVERCPDGSWHKDFAHRCRLQLGHSGPHHYEVLYDRRKRLSPEVRDEGWARRGPVDIEAAPWPPDPHLEQERPSV
jgi:hypothetical protein